VPQFNPDIDSRIEVSGSKYIYKIGSKAVLQVKALPLVIASLKELIRLSRAQIKYTAFIEWQTKYSNEEASNANPFDKEQNDYTILMLEDKELNGNRAAITFSNKSSTLKDDFIQIAQGSDGTNNCTLTENFYLLSEDLNESFEKIYFLLLKNKLVNPLKETKQVGRRKVNQL
jgi:hypothetical protein